MDAQGHPLPSPSDMARAVELNAEWDKVRAGIVTSPKTIYPAGSVGDGYHRAVRLREAERKAKGIIWTVEQEKRDDWPRAWRWLDPVFGDVDPGTVQPEHFLTIDDKTGKAKGLIPLLEGQTSPTERHRVIKVWRALWKKMAAMNYCRLEGDPTLTFANSAPNPRQDIWQHREVVRLVQRAWRMGYKGLAAMMAVGWDTMLSPIDVRGLSTGQMARDGQGALFFLDRAKTGRAAAGTLTQWSESILQAYVRSLGVELHDARVLMAVVAGCQYRTRRIWPASISGRCGAIYSVLTSNASLPTCGARVPLKLTQAGRVTRIFQTRWQTRSGRLCDCARPITR